MTDRTRPRRGEYIAWTVAVAMAAATGCQSDRLRDPDPTSRSTGALSAAAPARTAPTAKPTPRLEFVRAAEGDVPALVLAAEARAKAADRKLLVYVGATWCEPCKVFHEAAVKGELDAELPALTLLEFDADRDGDRLRPAGYASTYIPLFVVPGEGGRASSRFVEGGIKGDGAARQLAPRLRKLLNPT